ncbi:MAG: hypothetical protein KUG75_07430 [Pseudomonadales bacterium]|nr:hypothetical protein [Pseudomonadales bacterium]
MVFNPLEYADFLAADNNPGDFPFMASLDEYWSLYDKAVLVSQRYGGDNSEYMTMLKVIGFSTTVEYMFKSLYENTVGSFTYWTASGEITDEDKIIMRAQRAYSDLIFDQAWYKFNFSSWIGHIWKDTDFFGSNFIRKTERKLFFSLEFGFKSLYAKLIGFASQAAFEQGDGLIYLIANVPEPIRKSLPEMVTIVAEDAGMHLLSIPRWGAFTTTLPLLLTAGADIVEISGNKKIAVSYLVDESTDFQAGTGEEIFDSRVVSNINLKRKVLLVDVSQLGNLFSALEAHKIRLEHIYDY